MQRTSVPSARPDSTASVHYVRWDLNPAQVTALGGGPATLVADHADYRYETELSDDTQVEILGDAQ